MYFIRVSWKSIADVETEEGREGGRRGMGAGVGGRQPSPTSELTPCLCRQEEGQSGGPFCLTLLGLCC